MLFITPIARATQGNRRYPTSPAIYYNSQRLNSPLSLYMYFLNLSPINAELTSLS